jgi:hypothetical protein
MSKFFIRTTRAQRLRTQVNRKRAEAAASLSRGRPDSLVTFLCNYGDASVLVLVLLSVGDVGRLEMTSKRFHPQQGDPPLRSDVLWRELWIDSKLRVYLEKETFWQNSSWGKRLIQTQKDDPTTLPQTLTNNRTQCNSNSMTTTSNITVHKNQFGTICWRNTYRAGAISWAKRRSSKLFKKLVRLQRSGALPQSLQRTISSCHLHSFEFLANGIPLKLLRSTKGHSRLWSSQANRIGSTLSSDGARFFSSSIAVKVDWSPDSAVKTLGDLETIDLWTTSTLLKRKRKIFSMKLGGVGFDCSHRKNSPDSSPIVHWKNYCVIREGDFCLYQIPENITANRDANRSNDHQYLMPNTKESSIVDVKSSVVIGTWCQNRSGVGGEEETIAFCMIHVHLQHVIERLLSPLPRGMRLINRPPFDDIHDCRGIRGYTLVLSVRSFARCCWETQCTQFDLSRKTLRGCILENGQVSWDTALHFGLEPSLLCRTACFTTKVDNVCVVEVTMYDEYQNVVIGSIDVAHIKPLELLLEEEKQNNLRNKFWKQLLQHGSFGATIDLESRCGIEIQSKVGVIQIGMCRVLADQSGERVLAVERLEVGIRDKWRKVWFG